jgi:hypothetical protein
MGYVDVVKAGRTCRQLRSRNSSGTGPERSRCLADSGYSGDDTGRKPGRCAEVFLAGQMSLRFVVRG